MDRQIPQPLDPVSFLQAFIVQSVRVGQLGCAHCGGSSDHVAKVGLAASHCLEEVVRQQLGCSGPLDPDQYADLIVEIKNRIGGQFERVPGEVGSIRVINHRCPFGDLVVEAPELCRMTSSVFGAIAARSFGYAKVELHKRIAARDGVCDVRVWIDPQLASQHRGDEYRDEGDTVASAPAAAAVTCRLEEKLCNIWRQRPDATERNQLRRRIVAESEAMQAALRAVQVVAPTTASVLVTGETGVGKEVIARALHALSHRAEHAFLPVNCGAIPENLVESALFGHEKGAFTNAHEAREGVFERAHGGTLFLDEIDCLPLAAQARLLRVLGGRVRAGRRAPPPLHRRSDHRRLEPRHRASGRGGKLPSGSVLPHQCGPHSHPSVARASGRHERPGGSFSGTTCPQVRRSPQGARRACLDRGTQLQLAR